MTIEQSWNRVALPQRDPGRWDFGILALRLVMGVVFLVAGLKLIIPKPFGFGDDRAELVASFTDPEKGWMAPWLVERIADLGIGIGAFLLVQGVVEVVLALTVIAGLMTPMVSMTLGMMLITFTIANPSGGPIRIARDLGIAAAAFGLARLGGGYWSLDRLIVRRADRLPRWFLVGSGLRAAARGGNHDPALLLMRLGMVYTLLASAIFTAGLFSNKLNTTVPVPLVLAVGVALAAGLFSRYLMAAIAVWLLIIGAIDILDKGPLLGLEGSKREIALGVIAAVYAALGPDRWSWPRPRRPRCREVTQLLGAYVDGELPPEDRRAVEFHLGDCADCWTFLATYRETVALGKELRDEDLPAAVYARLEDMTRSAEGTVVAPPVPPVERRPTK